MTRARPKRTFAGALSVETFEEEELGRTQDWTLIKGLLPFVRPQAALFVVALVLMPVTSLASLLQPYFLKLAIDAALVDRDAAALSGVVAMFAGALFVEFLARFGQVYTMQLAGQRSMARLRRAVFHHIQRLRVNYFDHTPIDRVVTRVTNDTDNLSELFASGAITAVADLTVLVGIVAFMLYLDWELTLVTLAALPPLAIVVEVFRRYARRAFREIRARVAQLNAYLAEQIDGITVVQAAGREDRCAAEYRTINEGYRHAHFRAIRYDALLYSVVESVAVASVAIVFWYASQRAGLLEARGGAVAYVGTVVAFYEYIQRFFVPIRDLSSKYTIIQSSLASAERIFGLLEVDEIDAPRRPAPPAPPVDADVAVAFHGVTFGYREDHPVLHDIDLQIRRGETLAVVGATGSGKTSLTALLLRLYELERGSILLEGRDVRTFDRRELRSRFAVVPQDVFLFTGTVLSNVTLGDPTPDRPRAEAALRAVGALSLVTRRPGGLDARVGERGGNFSTGERQLLALARALYRDPGVLILDEATSSIDSETEARLQAAVLTVVQGRTSIVIAHRLSTIRNADRIVVMHRGRIAEQGSHAELLARDGIFARLSALQFAEAGAPPESVKGEGEGTIPA